MIIQTLSLISLIPAPCLLVSHTPLPLSLTSTHQPNNNPHSIYIWIAGESDEARVRIGMVNEPIRLQEIINALTDDVLALQVQVVLSGPVVRSCFPPLHLP